MIGITMEPFPFDELESKPSDFSPDVDPRLQFAATVAGSGVTRDGEIHYTYSDVAALVTDFGKWEALSDVEHALHIGPTEDGKAQIVTGRIPLQKTKEILSQECVLDIEYPRDIEPLLQVAVPESEAHPEQLPPGHQTNGGKGVLVGIVDHGCDIVHANFRNPDGTTRLTEFWDQNGPLGSSGSSPHATGASYSSEQINQALSTPNPYMALNYISILNRDGSPEIKAHGTHVMDIAAGNGQGLGIPGYAPEADLMFVEPSSRKMPVGPEAVGQSLGDSTLLLKAIKYIFDRSASRPTVVNVSLGGHGGPHDGSTLVERGIDTMLRAAPNRAVVIAAGNCREYPIHKRAELQPGEPQDVQWVITQQIRVQEELEIWYPGNSRVRMELIGPGNQLLMRLDPSENDVQTLGYNVALYGSSTISDLRNNDNCISLFFAPGTIPKGVYTARLTLLTDQPSAYWAWIERNNTAQGQLVPPVETSMTLGSISCGRLSIAVGAYDAADPGLAAGSFSSEGPTRDGREKPELSAPGVDVIAACSGTGTKSFPESGTSMAAPAVSGIIALVFGEARARGIDLSIQDLRALLFRAARRQPPEGDGWHPQYGYGRLSAKAALEELDKL